MRSGKPGNWPGRPEGGPVDAVTEALQFRLRPMREEDLSQVLVVELAAYDHPWSEGIFLDCLRAGYCCWLGTVAGQVVGHGVMAVAAGESHLLNICVHPRWQGFGFGRLTLRFLLDIARRHRADTAFLEVRASNRAAIALYQSEGFNEIGQRRGYYPKGVGGREDALVFAKGLV
jgi:ribosomal-protein-alanine N-acetyltransferase